MLYISINETQCNFQEVLIMPFGYNPAAAPAAATAATVARTSPGWGGLIPLFILVGLLALFIPGGFFFILLLILLLILICSCGVCGGRY
jgi:predicted lipid-binding transport protein (Tim44 family)